MPNGMNVVLGMSARIFPFSLAPDVVLYGAKRGVNAPRTLARLIGSGFFPEP